LLGVAKNMGFVDKATLQALESVNKMADSFNTGTLSADGFTLVAPHPRGVD